MLQLYLVRSQSHYILHSRNTLLRLQFFKNTVFFNLKTDRRLIKTTTVPCERVLISVILQPFAILGFGFTTFSRKSLNYPEALSKRKR